jgi:hypothetical protein
MDVRATDVRRALVGLPDLVRRTPPGNENEIQRKIRAFLRDMDYWVQRIDLEFGSSDGWICICGNRRSTYGFDPCLANGELCDQGDPDWESLYRCLCCGSVIDSISNTYVPSEDYRGAH